MTMQGHEDMMTRGHKDIIPWGYEDIGTWRLKDMGHEAMGICFTTSKQMEFFH